jgi:hypothetical protein
MLYLPLKLNNYGIICSLRLSPREVGLRRQETNLALREPCLHYERARL